MRYYFLSFFLFITTLVNAQTTTTIATVYKEFQPATIHLTDGRKLKVSLANVFLKNSSLLYLSGNDTKEANMKTLTQVDFPDRTYYTVDTLLAYQVDTVGHDALLCAQKIDFASWKQQIVNNSNITHVDFGDLLSYSTVELTGEREEPIPVISFYFFRLNGKYVLVHERTLKLALNKEKRRMMQSIISEDGFSWTDEKRLLKLLKYIQ